MAEWDHWQPVLAARRLGRQPLGVQLAGRELVLFRDGAGRIGALDDCCPHRRMRLSMGTVIGDRLHCRYHGWSYDTDGHGESPGTPKLHTCAAHYDSCERYGAIWLRAAGSTAAFPTFEVEGFEYIGTLWHTAPVPLEIVLDNFTEVEHTPTTHALLGYEISRMAEVVTEVTPTADTVRVYNAGPQKKLSPVIELLFGVRTGDTFVDDWVTHFSPVYAVYDQYWCAARGGQEIGVRWKNFVFFSPLDEGRTRLTTVAFLRVPAEFGWRRALLFKSALLKLVDREVTLDMQMLDRLADKSPGIQGMKLSRFDKVLGLHRERIETIYRGRAAARAGG